MEGTELRRRIDGLGLTYTEAARRLGLSRSGLNHQMRDERTVSRQTEMLLKRLEQDQRYQTKSDLQPEAARADRRQAPLARLSTPKERDPSRRPRQGRRTR
jgi:hypothetical protein